MAIIVWKDMNTYQEVMYSINGDGFNYNLFYLICGMHVPWGVCNVLNVQFDCT